MQLAFLALVELTLYYLVSRVVGDERPQLSRSQTTHPYSQIYRNGGMKERESIGIMHRDGVYHFPNLASFFHHSIFGIPSDPETHELRKHTWPVLPLVFQ